MRGLLIVVMGIGMATTSVAGDVSQVVRLHLSGQTIPAAAVIEDAEWKALRKRLELSAKAAEKAVEAKERAIKAQQQGKKREDWPLEEREQLMKAQQAAGEARMKYLYTGMKQDGIDGTLWDLSKYVEKKERLSIVSSADEADLLVKVLGRRRSSLLTMSACIEVMPGPRLDTKALAAQKIEWPWTLENRYASAGEITKLEVFHAYTETEPFWRVEVEGVGGAKKYAGFFAADALDEFVKRNGKSLDATRISQP